MGRRKSAMQAPGSGFIQEKKQRGPFGLKRGGSSQEGRLPVSPSPPQTAQTESLSVNSHDESSIRPTSARQGTNDDAMEPISEGQQTPKAEAQTGVTGTTLQEEPQNTAGNEVGHCIVAAFQVHIHCSSGFTKLTFIPFRPTLKGFLGGQILLTK